MDKLVYEPLVDHHARDLLPIWADEDVIQFINIKKPCTLLEIVDRVNALKVFDVFVVYNDNRLIGVIGCPCIDELKLQYGVFYHFCKSSWGNGYATKATEWLLNFMREKYGAVTFFADVVANNVASEKILKHFGFKLISVEDGFERNGVRMKIHNYSL